MVYDETEKLPIVTEDFVFSVRAGMVHVGFFARASPLHSKGEVDERKFCVARVALHPDAAKALLDGLEKAQNMAKTGRPEAVN